MLFLDKQKEPFELKKGNREDITLLVEMYETFSPKGRYQGLPPTNTSACAAWLRHIFGIGENFLALRNGRMIGHAALLPDQTLRDGEYLVFVHQNYRGRGIGTQLTRSSMDRARSLELTDIWLTVDADNFIAIRLYRNFGFNFCDEKSFHSERKMTLHLESSGKSILTGIVRDDRYLEHMPGHTHPEHPSRLRAIHEMLDQSPPGELVKIPAEPARLEELELVHTPNYVKKVLKTADQRFTSLAPDTPACSRSYLSAWLAAGGCLRGLDALMEKQCSTCFCLVRPPGHHAQSDRAGGFCFFNNLGITARYAMKKYNLQRILILDWDIHHGNGIQELFCQDSAVLYLSTHDLLLYPYSGELEETGKGLGAGYTVNIPLSRTFEDRDILYIYREMLSPIIRRFNPQLILAAAGFDAHINDPIGRSLMTTGGFARLTRLMLSLLPEADSPPLLLSLEGGYHPRTLSECVHDVLAEMMQPAETTITPDMPSSEAEALVGKVKVVHKPYGVWVE